MEHAFFEESHAADRYVMGQLTLRERQEFEEHFVECPSCQQEIETAQGLRAGFRAIAAERPLPPMVPAVRPWVWLAAGLFFAGIPAAWLGIESSRRSHDVERERTAAAEWKKRFDQSEQMRKSVTQATIPVYSLHVVRGGDGDSAPGVSIVLPREPRLLVLLLENPATSDYLSYQVTISQVTITGERGRTVWQVRDLAQNTADSLAISYSSDLTPPGNYLLTLEGNARDGRTLPVARFRYRTLPQK